MNCAQVKEQLVDFLYDEMSAEARAAFTEHLRGCPGCSAEVASHQKVLAHARAALAGPLAEEPPVRIRAAVLEAAKAAASTLCPRRAARRHDEPGLFARLLRVPWLLPAFGAVSVATAVFLVRVLKNPEVIPGQRPQLIDERAPVAGETVQRPGPSVAAPEPAEAQAKADQEVSPAQDVRAARKAKAHGGKVAGKAEAPASEVMPRNRQSRDDLLFETERRGSAASAGKPSRFAEPPPPRPAQPARKKDIDDLLGSVGSRRMAEAPAEPVAKPSGTEGASLDSDEDLAYARPPARQAPATKKAAAAAADVLKPTTNTPSGRATHAEPVPAPAPSPSAPPVYAPAPAAPAATASAEKLFAKDKSTTGGGKGGPTLDESIKKLTGSLPTRRGAPRPRPTASFCAATPATRTRQNGVNA